MIVESGNDCQLQTNKILVNSESKLMSLAERRRVNLGDYELTTTLGTGTYRIVPKGPLSLRSEKSFYGHTDKEQVRLLSLFKFWLRS